MLGNYLMMIVKQKNQRSMSHVSKTTGNCLLTTMKMENNVHGFTVSRHREGKAFIRIAKELMISFLSNLNS